MSRVDKELLLTEKSHLEEMLQTLPQSHVIDRVSLKARIKKVEEELQSLNDGELHPLRLDLTFQGNPVFGSHGISASFATEALKAFTAAVTAVAAGTSTVLGKRGPLPNRHQSDLLITGTVVGSFGFELEEASNAEELFPGNPITQQAIMKVFELLKASVSSDDELTEVVVDLDSRVVENIHGFLEILVKEEALCALRIQDNYFSFQDLDQVRQSESRLRKDNIMEGTKDFIGEFLGVLPNKRQFEFQISDSGDIITGKIGSNINEPDEINQLLRRTCHINVLTKKVGNGKPRYTLKTYKIIKGQKHEQ